MQLFAPAKIFTENECCLFCRNSFSFQAPMQTLGKANNGRSTALEQTGWNWTNVPFFLWCFYPIPVHGLPLTGFAITPIWHTRIGRTPLDEWSARRSDLYLTTHDVHKRHIPMQPAGFEPTIPASERRQTHALDRAATDTDNHVFRHAKIRLWGSKESLANARKLLLYRHSETDIFGGVPLHRFWISSFLSNKI